MGFRFRQSFKIMPGLRLNLSKTGHSWSLGAPGYTANFRKGRVRTTASIPGTGLSYVTETGGKGRRSKREREEERRQSAERTYLSFFIFFILCLFVSVTAGRWDLAFYFLLGILASLTLGRMANGRGFPRLPRFFDEFGPRESSQVQPLEW